MKTQLLVEKKLPSLFNRHDKITKNDLSQQQVSQIGRKKSSVDEILDKKLGKAIRIRETQKSPSKDFLQNTLKKKKATISRALPSDDTAAASNESALHSNAEDKPNSLSNKRLSDPSIDSHDSNRNAKAFHYNGQLLQHMEPSYDPNSDISFTEQWESFKLQSQSRDAQHVTKTNTTDELNFHVHLNKDEHDRLLHKPPRSMHTSQFASLENLVLPKSPYKSIQEQAKILHTGIPSGAGMNVAPSRRPRHKTKDGRYRAGMSGKSVDDRNFQAPPFFNMT
jgi:hypothetical protein